MVNQRDPHTLISFVAVRKASNFPVSFNRFILPVRQQFFLSSFQVFCGKLGRNRSKIDPLAHASRFTAMLRETDNSNQRMNI